MEAAKRRNGKATSPMKIDPRLFPVLSRRQLDWLQEKAERLELDEWKIFHFVVKGFLYPVEVSAGEISTFPKI